MSLLIQSVVEKPARTLRLPVVRDARGQGSPDGWPAEVKFILSAIDAGGSPRIERRACGRTNYHVIAELKLYSDAAARVLYCRDVTARSMGFITRDCLPLGHGGRVYFCGPSGEELSIDCSIRRCKSTVKGWFEGSMSFNREQWALDAESFSRIENRE